MPASLNTIYDDGMLEVEIHHDGREKEVRFNGVGAWVGTRWDIRRSELPRPRTAVANSGYASYRMDDIEYVQTPSADYYLVELERERDQAPYRFRRDHSVNSKIQLFKNKLFFKQI